MKVIFNDASELSVQQVTGSGDHLQILSLEDPATLRSYFEDPLKVKKLTVQERGQTVAEYEGYTDLYSIAWTPGEIYIVTMYKPDQTPEAQTEKAQAAVLVAQIQAQELTDAQAITVKAIYPEYDPNGVLYPSYFKVQYNGALYKCQQEHTSQPGWEPGVAPSLWVLVETGEQAGTKGDPIPVPDTVTTAGMEYEKGKYYSEGGTVYLMNRQGMSEGEKATLYSPPSALVGQYFEIVEG